MSSKSCTKKIQLGFSSKIEIPVFGLAQLGTFITRLEPNNSSSKIPNKFLLTLVKPPHRSIKTTTQPQSTDQPAKQPSKSNKSRSTLWNSEAQLARTNKRIMLICHGSLALSTLPPRDSAKLSVSISLLLICIYI